MKHKQYYLEGSLNPVYAEARTMVWQGKIKTFVELFAVLPLDHLAQDLNMTELELWELSQDMLRLKVYQIRVISQKTGIPHFFLANLTLDKGEMVWSSISPEDQKASVEAFRTAMLLGDLTEEDLHASIRAFFGDQ